MTPPPGPSAAEGGAILRLQVGAAAPRDQGRAILRLAPEDMAALGLRGGDVAELSTPGAASGAEVARAHVRVLSNRPDLARAGTAPLDLAQREGLGLALGERVHLRRLPPPPVARRVALRRDPGAPAPDEASLRAALADIPVAEGERLHVPLPGGGLARLIAGAVAPSPVAVIGAGTELIVDGAPAEPAWDGVGGLEDQIRRVREMVELPLRRPDLFARLGLRPPRGILFTGPPGSGKTLLARAVARRAGLSFHAVDGPEIMSKHYGDSEKRLRDLFARAAHEAPAVIFIDEIDAIAPRRDAVSGEKQLERRVVAQLLTLLDGMDDRGEVVAMAATNLPQALDPALRRPGRFDREIAFGAPDAADRRAILGVHLAQAPLGPSVDLEGVAEDCRGFVGADLAALAREAAMAALARAGQEAGGEALIAAQDLRIEPADFAAARALVGPSTLRDAALERPRTGWADVGGLDEAKQALAEAVIWPLRHPEAFRRLGVRPSRGVLLTGPPGGGKTLLARALAGESGANFIPVRATQLMSRWLGDAERAVEEVFARARGAAPCVLFFDELDAMAPRREAGGDQAATRVVAQLLTEIDGVAGGPGPFILGATNRPDAIDPALLRPGRFDLILHLPPPDRAARAEILAVHARGRGLEAAADLDRLADRTEGWSGAELAALVEGAARHALRRLARGGWSEAVAVASEDVETAIAERDRRLAALSAEPGAGGPRA